MSKRTMEKKIDEIKRTTKEDKEKGIRIQKIRILIAVVALFVGFPGAWVAIKQLQNVPEPSYESIDYNDSRYFIDLSLNSDTQSKYVSSILGPLENLENVLKTGNVYNVIDAYKTILLLPYYEVWGLTYDDIQKYAGQGYKLAVDNELWREVVFFSKYMDFTWTEKRHWNVIPAIRQKCYEIGLAYYHLGNIDFAIRCWNVYFFWAQTDSYHSPETLFVSDLIGQYFWYIGDYFSSLEYFRKLYNRTMENPDDVLPMEGKQKIFWENNILDYIVSNYGKLKLEREGLMFIENAFSEETHKIENYYLKSILYSYFDSTKSMNYYEMVKKMENPNAYNIEYLFWCNRKNIKPKNMKKIIEYYTKKYGDDEPTKNLNIAVMYSLSGKFTETRQYLQKTIETDPKNVIVWMLILKDERFNDFRKTNEFILLLKDNIPVMKITEYGGSNEIDLYLEFLRDVDKIP